MRKVKQPKMKTAESIARDMLKKGGDQARAIRFAAGYGAGRVAKRMGLRPRPRSI